MSPTREHARSSSGSHEPVTLFDGIKGSSRHVCGFFRSEEERYRILLPFIKEGFERGEKAFHVVDPRLREDHMRRLQSVGIDVGEAAHNGQFELCHWEEIYLPDGRFDQDRMLASWQTAFDDAGEQGFPLTRLVAQMEWALEDRPGVHQLLEYEARFNLLPPHPDPVICAYDLAKFPGDVVLDVIRTHPLVLIGGVLQENPFFIPPDQFVRELREREAAGGGRPA
jgi:hypothetical protein